MELDLRNETIRRYHDLAGTIQEDYFYRFAAAVRRGALGRVFALDRVAERYGSLRAFLEHTGLWGVAEAGVESAASFALLEAIPSLDVNVGQSGFTVTSVGSMAPASWQRVERLRDAVQTRAYAALAQLYTALWTAYPGLGTTAQGCLQAHPWRDALCNDPHDWRSLGTDCGVELHHFFTRHDLLQSTEEEVAVGLLGPHFYTEMINVANGPSPEDLPQPIHTLRAAIYLLASHRLHPHSATELLGHRRLRMARLQLEQERERYPLWAGSPYDTGQNPLYADRRLHESFFKS